MFGAHAHVGARLVQRDRWTARALAGGGAYGLTTRTRFASDDLDPDIAYGLAATYDLAGALRVRVDGRHHLTRVRDGGTGGAFEVNGGLEWAPGGR